MCVFVTLIFTISIISLLLRILLRLRTELILFVFLTVTYTFVQSRQINRKINSYLSEACCYTAVKDHIVLCFRLLSFINTSECFNGKFFILFISNSYIPDFGK